MNVTPKRYNEYMRDASPSKSPKQKAMDRNYRKTQHENVKRVKSENAKSKALEMAKKMV